MSNDGQGGDGHNSEGGPGPGDGHGHGKRISITVDGVTMDLDEDKWNVRDLKEKVGVPAAKVLAEIKPNGLKDLDDDAKIELHDGDRFMSHARSGGSS